MRLILQGGFWFMVIPFGSIAKFQFLARFPLDHFPNIVVSNLKLFLR